MTAEAKHFLYSPALRMKAGELLGLYDLAPDISDCIVPRLIVPPPSERKGELEPQLLAGERFPDVSKALCTHWPKRDVLLESTHLLREFARSRLSLWLPRMFESARRANARPIPLVAAKDLVRDDIAAYRAAIDISAPLKFGIVFSSGELADDERLNQVQGAIEQLGIQPSDCVVIADFHDAEFSDPDVVAPIIAGVLDTLQTSAHWQQIIFQGTSYPETNPAAPGSCETIPRNEWLAWKQAVGFDPETANYLTFGDYAADCAKMKFKSGGAVPIPHYRYATADEWLVQRGLQQGNHSTIMRDVCKQLVQNPKFAGRTFSAADDYIYKTAHHGAGPGAAKEWRGVNTTHHITRVVIDIGASRGLAFGRTAVEDLNRQTELAV
ncbi:beta family protein [Mesorhizobium sp. M0924]|uniref:beta family protein n=1 Tax=unclassified Mesorhizobium TaxID=325217 RepID=UPI00333D9DBF